MVKDVARRAVVEQIYGNALAEARYTQIENDLRKFASEDMVFAFDPSGTQLFSLMELRQSYARRSVHLVESIYLLLEADEVIPAAIIGRSLIETIAMGALFLSEMNDCVRATNKERLELRLTRFFAGVAGRDPKPIHVMDAIRHLHKLDAEYVAHLDRKFGFFSELDKMRQSRANGEPIESHADLLSMVSVYDKLSEIAHPNGAGVQYLYPDPQNEDAKVKDMRQYYKRLAVSATWQCKHLLEALEETRNLPEQYRSNIGTPPMQIRDARLAGRDELSIPVYRRTRRQPS
ncbi:hypothetical protein NKH84_24085 [Mesorhizobium sp. M0902]